MGERLLDLHGLVKSFPLGNGIRQRVLGPFDFHVETGEIVAIIGNSGAGKSTLLRIMAGLENADEGNHQCCGVKHRGIPPRLGFVFQQHSLFPWLTARENVAFGLRRQGLSRKLAFERANSELIKMGLAGSEGKYPFQLSGGMKQKVAIARTMVTEPRLLLLDEPFASLDLGTRRELDEWLRVLLKEEKTTAVLVTHDLEEALRIADRIVVLTGKPGRIVEDVKRDVLDAKERLMRWIQ